MGPKWVPKLVPNGFQNGPQNGSQNGPKMGPKMVRCWSKKGPLFDAFFDRFYNKFDVVFRWLLSLFLLLSVSFLFPFFSFPLFSVWLFPLTSVPFSSHAFFVCFSFPFRLIGKSMTINEKHFKMKSATEQVQKARNGYVSSCEAAKRGGEAAEVAPRAGL